MTQSQKCARAPCDRSQRLRCPAHVGLVGCWTEDLSGRAGQRIPDAFLASIQDKCRNSAPLRPAISIWAVGARAPDARRYAPMVAAVCKSSVVPVLEVAFCPLRRCKPEHMPRCRLHVQDGDAQHRPTAMATLLVLKRCRSILLVWGRREHNTYADDDPAA